MQEGNLIKIKKLSCYGWLNCLSCSLRILISGSSFLTYKQKLPTNFSHQLKKKTGNLLWTKDSLANWSHKKKKKIKNHSQRLLDMPNHHLLTADVYWCFFFLLPTAFHLYCRCEGSTVIEIGVTSWYLTDMKVCIILLKITRFGLQRNRKHWNYRGSKYRKQTGKVWVIFRNIWWYFLVSQLIIIILSFSNTKVQPETLLFKATVLKDISFQKDIS